VRELRIAVYVPCWRESAVIGNMVRHNLATVKYSNFDIFLGVYPNDEPTIDAVTELSRTFRNVHVAVCPHPGPTSKADCLNWIYHRMASVEQAAGGQRFDTIVLHDAEDVIHPEALDVINRARARYSMVQIPVLPLPTPLSDITHAIYCDEFAEFSNDRYACQATEPVVHSVERRGHRLQSRYLRPAGERAGADLRRDQFDLRTMKSEYIFIGWLFRRSSCRSNAVKRTSLLPGSIFRGASGPRSGNARGG
jgi:hypothetical protein